MRLNRNTSLFLRLLLLPLAAGALQGQILVTLSTTSLTLTGGGSATLTAVCTAPSGNTGVNWSYSPQVGTLGVGNNAAGTSVTTTNNYAAPATVTSRQSITITATSKQDHTQSASVTIQLTPASITVTPATVSLAAGGSTQFSASGGSAGYVWSISPQTGTIDQTGFYNAPSSVASTQTVTVTATSSTDATVSGTAKITLTATPAVRLHHRQSGDRDANPGPDPAVQRLCRVMPRSTPSRGASRLSPAVSIRPASTRPRL